MIKTIFAFFMAVLTVIICTAIGIIGLVFWLIGFRKPMTFCMYKVAQLWGIILIAVTGCRVEVRGKENIPRKGGVCFVSNHGSVFDIILALAHIGRPFGFIAKKELLFLPLINMWISLLGGLFIDRKNPRNALKTINEGIERLKKGGGMLIFPEGRRSRGEGLLPFHSGSFKLATQSGVPIVPVSILGSYEVYEKNRRVNSCSVRIVFSPPVVTDNIHPENRRQYLSDQIRLLIEEGLK